MHTLTRSPFLKRFVTNINCRLHQLLTHQAVCNSQKRQLILSQRSSYCSKSLGPWTVHQLTSRGLVRLKGPDTIPFLQGLVTNDVTHLGDLRKAMFAMMLNVQGRVMYDLIIYDFSKKNEDMQMLIECDKSVTTELMKTMKMYKLRKKIDLADVSQEYCVFAALPPVDNTDNVWVLSNLAELPMSAQDPRVDQFGWRIISADEKSLTSSFKSASDVNVKPEEVYHETRYRWGIAEGVTDLPPGNCFPLESNLVYMNGVCFVKGCYIGQELTARTHHTGATRKRLMPLVFESHPLKLNPGDSITTESGKNAGKFRNAVGRYGLGLMRLANVTGQLTVTNENGVKYITSANVPSWWPTEENTDSKS